LTIEISDKPYRNIKYETYKHEFAGMIFMSETHYNSTTKMLNGFPKIKKLGAVSPNGESTPFVWNNRLMRLELDDATNGVDSHYKTSAVIRDRKNRKNHFTIW